MADLSSYDRMKSGFDYVPETTNEPEPPEPCPNYGTFSGGWCDKMGLEVSCGGEVAECELRALLMGFVAYYEAYGGDGTPSQIVDEFIRYRVR